MVRRLSIVTSSIVVLALVAGCSSGGGGGSGKRSSTGSAGSGTTGGASVGSTSSGSSGTPSTSGTPAVTIIAPARGEAIDGPQTVAVSLTATNTSTVELELNGTVVPATLSGTSVSATVTPKYGTNILSCKATSGTGESTYVAWSFIWAPAFLSATQLVPDAVQIFLTANGIASWTPVLNGLLGSSALLGQALAGQTFSVGGISIVVSQVNVVDPAVTFTPKNGSIGIGLDATDFDVTGTFGTSALGITTDGATIAFDLALSVNASHQIAADVQNANVTLVNPAISPAGLAFLVPFLEPALELALDTALPPAIEASLNGAFGTYGPFALYGLTASGEARPGSISQETRGEIFSADVNAQIAISTFPVPAPPSGYPGSASNPASSPPDYHTAPGAIVPADYDLVVSLSRDALNRGAFVAWQASPGVKIDQAFLQSLGISLPFALDASWLIPFFPVLPAPPAGQPVPITLEIMALQPATFDIPGVPSMLVVSQGEVHVSVTLEYPSGPLHVVTVALHGEIGASASIQNGFLQLTLGQPVQVSASLLDNPLGLRQVDIDSFLNSGVQLAVSFLGGLIPPIPVLGFLPLPAGIPSYTTLDVWEDGAAFDYLSIGFK